MGLKDRYWVHTNYNYQLPQVFACSIVKSELAYGAFKSLNPDRTYRKQQQFLNLFVSLPFDDTAALVFGRLNAQLEANYPGNIARV
ncbi:type II toxin-antitoxin system VapC family toxin [Pleurocapsa sp. CCALA 161]|uniref:type II toxin-antitoxin system VapC family toxin n=1 Tax=Pleurocapsa sp. CCALA 161 TaxID=2107688 RepID=UPI0018ED7FF1|nr:type II toxin-antitoxin system VapC family toxin [Pleurocapsa sp. CCALA 161]